jgi:hypothetical protein
LFQEHRRKIAAGINPSAKEDNLLSKYLSSVLPTSLVRFSKQEDHQTTTKGGEGDGETSETNVKEGIERYSIPGKEVEPIMKKLMVLSSSMMSKKHEDAEGNNSELKPSGESDTSSYSPPPSSMSKKLMSLSTTAMNYLGGEKTSSKSAPDVENGPTKVISNSNILFFYFEC